MRFCGILVFALGIAPAQAGEYVIFASGQRIVADRHEREGDVIRLYREGGVIEVPSIVVTAFEPDGRPEKAIEIPAAATPVENVPAPAPPSSDPRTLVREAAARAGLPATFVESVAQVESAFRPDAVSPKGAIGVMQLMPATAKALGADPHDLRQNIDAGTRLLRELLLKYEGDVVKALAAYNAGEGAVDRYDGLPPYNETRHYVNKVIGAYQRSEQQSARSPQASQRD